MNRLKTWLAVVGALAVTGSLVFLGIQISQDRKLKRAELAFFIYGERQEDLRTTLGENLANSYEKPFVVPPPVELANSQLMVLSAFAETRLIDWQRSARMEQLGSDSGEIESTDSDDTDLDRTVWRRSILCLPNIAHAFNLTTPSSNPRGDAAGPKYPQLGRT